MPTLLESELAGETSSISIGGLEALAHQLGVPPGRLQEYRLALVTESLLRKPQSLHLLFLEALSSIERDLIQTADFSDQPFGPTVRFLLVELELTQQELRESVGVPQPTLSRVMNGYEKPSVELLETIAQALDTPPEVFLEYRLALIDDWLRDHPERTDELYEELTDEPTLAEYRAWAPRTMPDPRVMPPRGLIESLLEIVRIEGPVMGARVYELRLAASELVETKELRSLLNRATAAAARAGLLLDENERGDATQKFRILRMSDQPEIHPRELGPRRLWQVPLRELEVVLKGTSAWKRGAEARSLQLALLATYGVSTGSLTDAEHLNRCIMRSRQGGNS
jgi:transcriptional regulator with XRE-family HTH domain